MRKLIEYFIKYPVMGNAILVAIFLFGYLAFTGMKTTFFPEISSDTIIVSASYPGASPEEIEEGITLKIEDNLKGVTGIDRVTSTSSENSAQISVEIKPGYDINVLVQEVTNAVDQISSFPVGMEQIRIYKSEPLDFVISFALTGDVDLKTLKTTARRIERDLRNKGVSKISISGFPDEEIEISLRENDLRAYGLTFTEVANAVSNASVKVTGGTIRTPAEEFLIRANTQGYYAEDLRNLVIRSGDAGATVRLSDVADVQDKWSEDPNRTYLNGEPSVIVDVNKTNDEDMFAIAEIAKNYMEGFNNRNDDVQLVAMRDGSAIIEQRANILTENGVFGMILVLLFLSLSLNPRLSLWVALAIPLSFAGMFMLGAFYGLTINVMSLMAMILVIGILVDDGIVIAENIYQHHENGEKPIEAAVNGTLEVLPSVIAAVLTTVVFFLTFLFLEGDLGQRTIDMTFVVGATLLISLVEGIFILPAHIAHSKALRESGGQQNRLLRYSEKALHWLRDKTYAPLLNFSIKNPLVAVAVPVTMMIITIGAISGSLIKVTLFPIIESDNVSITLEMPAGTRDTITDSLLATIETRVWEANADYKEQYNTGRDLITSIGRRVGSGNHEGNLRITLEESQYREISSLEATNLFRGKIGTVREAQNLQIGGGSRWGMPVSIALQSDNLEQLRQAKEQLKAELRQIDKLKDVVDDDPQGLQEVNIVLKDKAFALGLTTGEVMSQVRSGFFGKEAQRVLRGIDEVRIWVRYVEADRAAIGKLEEMRIRLDDGRAIPLKEIADLSLERGVLSVKHIDAQRVVKVEADITNANESVTDILADISADIMPGIINEFPDVTYAFEGQSRESDKTTGSFASILPVMLMLMFLIVVFTFRSFAQAGIVFLTVPFSLIGVAWGHFIQGYVLSMLSLFGVIALVGVAINDSLVFVTTLNRLLKTGKDFSTALYETGVSRFRPVILTSLTTIAGLGPLIFESSRQAQFLAPMAIAMAYGLLFATLLTLLMLPAMLVLFNRLKVYLFWMINGEKPTPELVEPALREDHLAIKS